MRQSATTLESELHPAELQCLRDLLSENPRSGRHLEIGTAAGGTLKALMLAYPPEARPPFSVVDPMTYFPNQLDLVRTNLRSAGLDPEAVDFRVGTSAEKLGPALAVGDTFSFVFIDGNHKARYVIQDLTWCRMLEVGGHVCLHDYKPRFPGVVWATDRFLRRYPNYRVVHRVESLIVLRKERASARPEVTRADLVEGGVRSFVEGLSRSLAKRIRR